MSVDVVEVGPGCTVEASRVESSAPDADGRVTVTVELEVVSDGACRWLTFPLPEGATLGDTRVKERRNDGGGPTLDAARWTSTPRGPAGSGAATLHVPDLWSRDRVRARIAREHVPAAVALAWTAGRPAELAVEPLPAVVTGHGRVLRLVVPPGNPQISLHPEGAARSHVDDSLVVAAADTPRRLSPGSPEGVVPELRTEPAGAASLVRVGGVWVVEVAASEAPARLVVSWDDPACPTHGERGPLDELTVQLEGGRIQWDADRWVVESVGEDAVLPSREALIRGLDRRFKSAALPEPGVPSELRGRVADDALLADLRPHLAARAPTLPAAGDPLFVRPLVKARRSGALTPTEAMVVTWLYARQLRFDAHWAFARPAPAETLAPDAPEPRSPSGYDAPLLLVVTPSGDRWLDPTCGACGPFELPPELEGARLLTSADRARTPEPTPGSLRVEVTGDEVVVDASGPPALLLRRALDGVPKDERSRALAAAVAGPGARLREATGVERGGEPLHLVAVRGDGLVPDPTALPAPAADGTAWLDWVGTRTFVGDAGAEEGVVARSGQGFALQVEVTAGRVTRTLEVTERRITP